MTTIPSTLAVKDLRMSSREIAEATDKIHRNVKRALIREGHFVVTESYWDHSVRGRQINRVTKVTQSGIEWLMRWWKRQTKEVTP